ncbi:hypothetical protein CHLNCDRAFT_133235 [Chlorella variabilis]|uniref:BZIP domain-containing protein n=1 Tax=Chlorella variabilis TaxID=554065 RepID=E1Z2N6_CHLVA|nr:hypothetical protein CHLNCDRAFT_133235 [Chlorella variabilis]EFN59694.1 hypothetical protein CHLNCDRAFT_133235 [Chlorella variabilis]|eukprot:XP_005851796.1 hypothetical protein CHLNCDRAFT_133235 [Chlorella variabilis]
MCRFTVRAPPAGGPAAQPPDLKLEAPLDLDVLFEHGTEDLDANDLALLALFSGNNAPAPAAEKPSPVSSCAAAPTADASNTVVMGQALCVPAGPQGVLPVAPPAAVPIAAPANPANPVQQLQFQAVMQHQAAIMQNPQAYPAAAQMYQQAMLQQQQQQQMLAAQQQVAAAAAAAAGSLPVPAPMLMGKRSVRSQEEVEEQTERIKKRRRESAQRSRQRKNAYMKSLEMENRALKMENERLRVELSKGGGGGGGMPASAFLPKASSGSVSRHESAGAACSGQQDGGSDHVSLSDDEEGVGLCGDLAMGMPPLDASPADIAHDALALMPTADLLNFAF